MASYTIIDFTRRGDQVALVLEAVDDEAIIASSRKALSKGTTSFAVAQGRDPGPPLHRRLGSRNRWPPSLVCEGRRGWAMSTVRSRLSHTGERALHSADAGGRVEPIRAGRHNAPMPQYASPTTPG